MAMSQAYIDQYWEQGYAVLRGLLPRAAVCDLQAETRRIYEEGLKHPTTYRDRNLLFEILPESFRGRRYVLQAHWISWISPYFEQLRRSEPYRRALIPLLGADIKQVAQQIHWKPPGAERTGFRFHQDLRFRERRDAFRDLMTSYITTGLAIDPATRENGCLRIIPGSHRLGYLGLSDDGPLMKGVTEEPALRAAGLDPEATVDLELEPGDLVMWSLLTVHGSDINRSQKDRAFLLSSYVKAANSDRGEWTFRGGESVALGSQPQLCKYEQLHTKPGPFYSDDKWYAD
ncbi:MAG TPA: phytanoyl-CoA dioxygenase family protein [Dongiaceae bacterium]|jgi:ectoine hydroxylase-related dioxygenase (phytanoyl-CoA dioxygenase family)|nr:phytanoyl-CoA dioxygenase family protein [Dongiaceae bacterium]